MCWTVEVPHTAQSHQKFPIEPVLYLLPGLLLKNLSVDRLQVRLHFVQFRLDRGELLVVLASLLARPGSDVAGQLVHFQLRRVATAIEVSH